MLASCSRRALFLSGGDGSEVIGKLGGAKSAVRRKIEDEVLLINHTRTINIYVHQALLARK